MLENLVWDAKVKVGSHQYCKLFQEKHEVLWLALPLNILSFMCAGLTKHERFKQWNNGRVVKENEHLFSWCPFGAIPYRNNLGFRSRLAADLSITSCFPSIKSVLEKNKFDDPDLVWISDPRYFPLLKYLKYKVLIYRCVDAFSHFDNIPESVNGLEEELIKSSDIVFATASSLLERVQKIKQDNIYLLNNGVDLQHFQKQNYLLPEDMKQIAGPTVVFVGALGEWFDTELIAKVASLNLEINYVLIGPVRTAVKNLMGLKNVYLLGPKSYDEVPNYMHFSDVCMIPFKDNDISKNVNPIKLYEYFALGKPCVATKTEEMRKISSPARLTDSPQDFYNKILEALNEKNSNEQLYKEYASQNSWRHRYDFFSKVINVFRSDVKL